MLHANNKGADKAAYIRSLISAFVIRYLASIVVNLAPCEISILIPASLFSRADWAYFVDRNPEVRFSRAGRGPCNVTDFQNQISMYHHHAVPRLHSTTK